MSYTRGINLIGLESQVLRETVNSVRLSCDNLSSLMVCYGMNILSNETTWPCLWACRSYYKYKGIELQVLHVAGSLISTE